MMADFVRDYVGAGEVAGCAEALRQLLEKREIEVHIAVAGAIKRPRRRAGEAACRARLAAEKHQLWRLIVSAPLLKHACPNVLGVAQNVGDEFLLLVARRVGAGRARRCWRLSLRLALRRCAAIGQKRQHIERVLAQQQADDDDYDDPADTQVDATDAGRSSVRTFLDIVATTEILPAHRGLPCVFGAFYRAQQTRSPT